MSQSYCELARYADKDNVHKHYHDNSYGFPIENDNELFGRLLLEINQAGLSWDTILKKEKNFRLAYDNFNIKKIASYDREEEVRLLANAGIIRNRLKIRAAIHNAQVICKIQAENGSFKNWLDQHHPQSKTNWVKLFKETFKFTGSEIVGEFLMSTGYLPGAHETSCATYHKVLSFREGGRINYTEQTNPYPNY